MSGANIKFLDYGETVCVCVGGGQLGRQHSEVLAAVTVAVAATHLNRMKDPPLRKSPAICVYFNPSWGSYMGKYSGERWK